MRALYRFEVLNGWVPTLDEQRDKGFLMAQVAPVIVEWDPLSVTGDPAAMSVTLDLAGRRTLEGLAVVVQAWNTVDCHVEGWPPQTQTCAPYQIGGANPPRVAVGLLDCAAIRKLPD